MKHKLKDVLHYYLPYKVQLKCSNIFRANSEALPLVKGSDATLTPDLFADIQNKTFDSIGYLKPILNPCLSYINYEKLTVKQFESFLKNHIDIFGLIESGQAIEKTI